MFNPKFYMMNLRDKDSQMIIIILVLSVVALLMNV